MNEEGRVRHRVNALKPRSEKGKQGKVEKTLHEYKHGELHSGSKEGPVVTDRKQALAIALRQSGQSKYQ